MSTYNNFKFNFAFVDSIHTHTNNMALVYLTLNVTFTLLQFTQIQVHGVVFKAMYTLQ